MKKIFLLVYLACVPYYGFCQIPSYYTSVDFTQTGESLRTQLTTLITSTHTTLLPYTSSSTDTWDAIKASDLCPASPEDVMLIYGSNDTDSETKNDRLRDKDLSCHSSSCIGLWNREHVFAKSLATPTLETNYPGTGTDAHNLRAADSQMNSSRSNRTFAAGTGVSYITSGSHFYPGDEWKGDVARILMYMYVRYPSQCLPENVGTGTANYAPLGDMLDLFLDWNAEDPVSEYEQNRNAVFENMQGNRNPFIDNPQLATRIWNGPATTDAWGVLEVPHETIENIHIYPRVTSGIIYVTGAEDKQCTVEVYSVLGQEVKNEITEDKVDLSALKPGLYIVRLSCDNVMKTVKIIKN